MTIWIGADVSKAKVHCAFERAPGKWQFKVFVNQAATAVELLVLERIAEHPIKKLHDLLPWNVAAQLSQPAAGE